jgi:DNA-binding MarR family transcriptional regulator
MNELGAIIAMLGKRFLTVVRELFECTRGFERYSSAHVRELGLTSAQFDIIATLGNTNGMSCKELGEKTLITKGTMTGVLDRLAAKGLLVRLPSTEDGRSWVTKLTPEGQRFFETMFPAHLESLQPLISQFSEEQLDAMLLQLKQFRVALERPVPVIQTRQCR